MWNLFGCVVPLAAYVPEFEVLLGAINVASIIAFIENLFHVKFMPQDVYQIADLPSQLQAGDVVLTAVVAFTLSILATLYPSYRASQVNPAEALRYE